MLIYAFVAQLPVHYLFPEELSATFIALEKKKGKRRKSVTILTMLCLSYLNLAIKPISIMIYFTIAKP
jgi:hypothetical protein